MTITALYVEHRKRARLRRYAIQLRAQLVRRSVTPPEWPEGLHHR